MFRFQQVTLGDIALVILAGLCAWAVIPGLGPELANLPTPGFSCQVKPHSKVDVVDAWQELCSLRLRQDSGPGGYKRDFFGGWKDLDHDGCDTRAEILARDFRHARFDSAKPCRLVGGVFHDPYTGKTTSFTAAPGAVVQIDHVVALGDAWASGANQWSNTQRQKYANDPAVLLAADGKANQDKGKLAADGWMPQNKSFRCAYARQQINIKYRWDLSVTPPERQALLLALSRC
ncbi:HNH endonuclease [Mobiluncus mulieris]|uniref:HNH endonuclease n=1 Tax=Mobiluncus mulieris TaxID=2052 RepID=A0A7Y0TZL2_9ACTO|nr:HNH endonuclease [Mobiluncus mulieris]